MMFDSIYNASFSCKELSKRHVALTDGDDQLAGSINLSSKGPGLEPTFKSVTSSIW